jgi:ribosomal protein S6
MANHSVGYVNTLEQQLRERFDRLLAAMQGTELDAEDLRMRQLTYPHRRINSGDIRVSVDDFATILKEIKASLGKR